MKPKYLIIILIVVVGLLVGNFAPQYIWRVICLRLAKHVAIEKLTPDDSGGAFDMVPVSLTLPAAPPLITLDSVRFGEHRLWFMKANSRKDSDKAVDLHYERLEVRVLTPLKYSGLDKFVKQWGMKDHFSVFSAAHHATRKGIVTQPDIESVKRNVLLLGLKSTFMMEGSETYYAQFEGADERGFLAGDITKGKRRVFAEVFPLAGDVDWGLLFRDTEGANMEDVKTFLSTIRVDEIMQSEKAADTTMRE